MLAESTLNSYNKYTLYEEHVQRGISTQVAMETEQSDCEITGIMVKTNSGTEQNIPADVIAQIDFEIAKSLKAAFSKIGDFSNIDHKPQVSSKGFLQDNKLDNVKNNKPRGKHSEDLKETAIVSTVTLETPSGLHKDATSVSKEMTELDVRTYQEESLPLSFKDNLQKSSKCCVNGILKSIASEDGQLQVKNDFLSEDLPDIVKEESSVDKGDKVEDDVVWICFICAKGFADQSKLMSHQDVCETERKTSVNDSLKPSVTPQDNRTRSSAKMSEKDSKSKSPPPVPTLLRKVGSNLKSLPLGIPTRRRERPSRNFTDLYIPPSRNVYFESLGLYPTPSVEAIYKSPRKSVSDEDCQIIDLTVDDVPQAVPMTPRTRSMLSQLSRDDSNGRRRQLSFSQTTQLPVTSKEPSMEKDLSEDSECSVEETVQQRHKTPSKSAILGIPLTSPLGQRLKKHWKYENKVPIVGNIEQFCKTNSESLVNLNRKEKKNPMVEKLRNRPPPQCTFKFTKKYINKWFHMYKFNKGDRKEFHKRIKFGLDRDSRLKLKRMKPCKVVVAKISKKDIQFWTTPRHKTNKRPLTNTTLSNMLNRQYRLNQMPYTNSTMPSANIIRQNHMPVYNPFVQPVQFVGPTPQLLVRTVAMGGQGMRLQVLPIQQAAPQSLHTFPPTNSGLMPVAPPVNTRSQKRKQVFNNVREDDGMVICLSSDEEDELVIKPMTKPQCSSYSEDGKVNGKRRIGPASFMRQQSRNNEPAHIVDMKPTAQSNVIHSKPVNTGQAIHQYQNTASARVFGQFNTQSVIVPLHPVQNSPIPNSPQLNITDNKVSVVKHVSGNDNVKPESKPTIEINVDTAETELVKRESQSTENDYMDYEVICIDSDDDDNGD